MQMQINTLIQLQELTAAKAQLLASNQTAHLSRLDEAIRDMLATLPPPVATQFARLHKRDGMAVVPVVAGVCTGCGLKLPSSILPEIKAGRNIKHCPDCNRILFMSPFATMPRLDQGQDPRHSAAAAGIARFSSQTLMFPHLEAETTQQLIESIVDGMVDAGFVQQRDALVEGALAREAIVTTAVDHGVAFPHVRGVQGGGMTLAVATCAKGLHFDPTARALTRIVFFLTIPTAASAFYLKLLSGLTQTVADKDNRDRLLEADTPADLWKALRQTTRKSIK